MDKPSLTIGIEEEYLLVDRETRDLVQSPDPAFHKACQEDLGGQVTPEFLQCQIEVGSKPVQTPAEARADLAHLRATVSRHATEHGYAIIAASTHPFAHWRDQAQTPKDRYDGLREDLAQNARRLLICGCHVHIAVEDEDLRIDLMNQAKYFLPHMLSLTCSSPFWEGEDTGLASYRLTVFDALPRTGLPDPVQSFSEYQRLVGVLTSAGCFEDASKIWWDIRPSVKFPTVEMRIADICTRIDDAVCIAAIYQSLFAFLLRLKSENQRWRQYPDTLIRENRWRAQRYGISQPMLDLGKGAMVPVPDLIEEIIELVSHEADRMGCLPELLHARKIAEDGTSADRQRQAYSEAIETGADHAEALRAVVDHLIEETVEGS